MKTNEHFYTAYFEPESLDWKPLVTPPPTPPTPNKGTKRPAPGSNGVPTRWPADGGWWVARTLKNVYTTDYFWIEEKNAVPVAFPPTAKETAILTYNKPAPPASAISWAFDVKDDGTMSVLVAFQRAGLHPAHIARVEEMLGGPLPDDEYVWVPSAELTALTDQPPTEPPPIDQPPARDAVPPTVGRPAPPGLSNARQLS